MACGVPCWCPKVLAQVSVLMAYALLLYMEFAKNSRYSQERFRKVPTGPARRRLSLFFLGGGRSQSLGGGNKFRFLLRKVCDRAGVRNRAEAVAGPSGIDESGPRPGRDRSREGLAERPEDKKRLPPRHRRRLRRRGLQFLMARVCVTQL